MGFRTSTDSFRMAKIHPGHYGPRSCDDVIPELLWNRVKHQYFFFQKLWLKRDLSQKMLVQRTNCIHRSNTSVFRRPSNAGASNSLNSGGLDGHGAISFFGHLATAVESFAIILAIIRIFLNLFGSFWIFLNLFESFWIFWILLDSFGFFWILLDSFGISWNLLESF